MIRRDSERLWDPFDRFPSGASSSLPDRATLVSSAVVVVPSTIGVQKLILASSVHRFGGLRPACARLPRRTDDQRAMFHLHLDLVRQLRVLEQRLRHTDAFRVT